MNYALQKTLELVLIIALGLLLQRKVAKSDLKGIKTLILSVALPATIFMALLKIELERSLLIFPLMALAFNFLMALAGRFLITVSLPNQETAKKRTLQMLLPSLAPGLSCFPFIMVYLGDQFLALAALADVGNKIFVLILLYLLAMHWYQYRAVKDSRAAPFLKLKRLLLSMLNEPINMVIIIALILLGFGFTLSSFPYFVGNTIKSMGTLMTPLVLLFIGMAVRINFKEFRVIFSLLLRRAGIAFCLSGLAALFLPPMAPAFLLLLVVFPQSSCSFWPFAHMSAVRAMEEKDQQDLPTFDIGFAVNVLACSLPFSTILVITIFSFQEFFTSSLRLLLLGGSMVLVSLVPYLMKRARRLPFFTVGGQNFSVMDGLNPDASGSEED